MTHWEWRCFCPPGNFAFDVFATIGLIPNPKHTEHCTDTYVVGRNNYEGLKWRGKQASTELELKRLVQSTADGLEQWTKDFCPAETTAGFDKVVVSKIRTQQSVQGVLVEQTDLDICAHKDNKVNKWGDTIRMFVRSIAFEGSDKNAILSMIERTQAKGRCWRVCSYPAFLEMLWSITPRVGEDHQQQQQQFKCSSSRCSNPGFHCNHCGEVMCLFCLAHHLETKHTTTLHHQQQQVQQSQPPPQQQLQEEPQSPHHNMPIPTDFESSLQLVTQQGSLIRNLKQQHPLSTHELTTQLEIFSRLKLLCAPFISTHITHLLSQYAVDQTEEIEKLIQQLPPPLQTQHKADLKKHQKGSKAKFDKSLGTENLRCQRKINHLLAHEGIGDTFSYFRELSVHAPVEGSRVIFTEKMDGTTVQATNSGVFKRVDNFASKSSEKWSCNDESQRYRLERLDLEHKNNVYIAEAVRPFLATISRLPNDVCIYFEAFGSTIGSRFSHWHVPKRDLVLFDVAIEGKFAPFEKTVELGAQFGLPVVAHFECEFNLDNVLLWLAEGRKYTGVDGVLEGFVIRIPNSEVALKVRVSDLEKIGARTTTAATSTQ